MQPALANLAGTNLGRQIAFALRGRAHVEQNQRENLAVDAATADDANGRNTQPFLEDLASRPHRPGKGSSNVSMVRTCGHIEYRPWQLFDKHGKNERDVGQMRSTGVGIVQN